MIFRAPAGIPDEGSVEKWKLEFEIQCLGVLGKPDNRRPAEKKFEIQLLGGDRETGKPETGWEQNSRFNF